MVNHHDVHSHAEVKNNCTSLVLLMISCLWRPMPIADGLYHVQYILYLAQNRFLSMSLDLFLLLPRRSLLYNNYFSLVVWEVQSGVMMAVSSVQQLVCSLNAAVEPVRYKYTLSLSIDV